MNNLKNKNIIITGASGGIGSSIVEKLYESGANILATGTRIEKLEELKKKFNKIKVLKFDISQHEKIEEFINNATEELGGSLDCIVNNAGITKDNLLMRMSEEDFDKVIEINLKSIFNMTKAIQRTFLKQRHGSMIHMSSVVGVKGNAGQANYAASKAGIIGFSKSIALELGSRNIRSNVIAPGFIETEMTNKLSEEIVQGWRDGIPLKRGGKPEDVANACVFLASDLSNYITGQVLHVDGGMLT